MTRRIRHYTFNENFRSTYPLELEKLRDKYTILQSVYLSDSTDVTYIVTNSRFKEITENEEVPEYKPHFQRATKNKKAGVIWKKV